MYHIGVDIGGTNIVAGIVDDNGKLIIRRSTKTGRHRPFADIMGDTLALCDEIMSRAGIDAKDITTIGIGTPGNVDLHANRVVFGNNIPSFTGADFDAVVKEHYPHMRLYLDNDANVAALAEAECGAAQGKKNILMVTLGTGVGGGIIIDGKICRGFNGAGGEIGHIIIEREGVLCNCGRRGCWEQYASVTALVRETEEELRKYPHSIIHETIDGDVSKISGLTAFDAMRKGDSCGKAIVEKYIEYIGIGIVDMVNVLQPEIVVIGGGISKEGDYIINPLREYVEKHIYTSSIRDFPRTEIVAAKMGNDAGIIGAALLYKQ